MKRFTIHCGNNQFPGVPGNDLHGCVNDAALMGTVLDERFGAPVERVELKNATVAQWRRAWADAAAAVTAGGCDYVTASISTHGTVLDDGDAGNFVQALVFADVDRTGAGLLLDREFNELIAAVPASARVEVWVDACHSATAAREAVFRAQPSHRPRCLPRFVRRGARAGNAAVAMVKDKMTLRRGSPVSLTHGNAVLLAACRDEETAADAWLPGAGNQYYGAFTWYWCQAFRLHPDLSRRTLIAATEDLLEANNFPHQHPQASEL